jgi:hypothetical protein
MFDLNGSSHRAVLAIGTDDHVGVENGAITQLD